MKKPIQKAAVFLLCIPIIYTAVQPQSIFSAEKRNTASFYSKMETPYVEIKSNQPGNEKYDVTTAIPANEPLYAGFGATEFMLNMEVEEKVSSGVRTYTLLYTSEKCIEKDAKCVISKTAHTHTCKDGTDRNGKPIMKKHTYTCGSACPKCGDRTACKGDRHSCSYKKGAVGIGCQVDKQINRAHPHSHTWQGKISQEVSSFSYMDIKGLELWQVNRLIVDGNKKLFVNPHHVINPFTGYRAFYNQEGYQNNNGRLVFSNSFYENQKYGNTKTIKIVSHPIKKTDADIAATKWMNQQIAGKKVKVKVISDFLSLTTTEGYQIPMFHEYESETVLITDEKFKEGSELKVIKGNPILFAKRPSFQEMWAENPDTAAKWEPEHITRSGYNGTYVDTAGKYDNQNLTAFSDKTAYLGSHPNIKEKEGEKDFNQDIRNQKMVRTGIETIETITDGFWNTGRCFLEADLEIAYGSTGGTQYGQDSLPYRTEVSYAKGFTKVNDIIRVKTWN